MAEEKPRIEVSGKISELIQKEKNFAMILEGNDTKFYVFGKIPENINVGDVINFNYVENIVGQYTYKNVQEIHPEDYEPEVVKPGATGETPPKSKVYFVDKFKDLKIVRQNVLRTSVMALEVLHKIDPESAARLLGEAGGLKNAIKDIARTLEEEVFRDESEDTKH